MDDIKKEIHINAGDDNTCACMQCHGHGYHDHHPFRLFKILIMLGILFVVFMMGIKLGELKGEFREGYFMMGGWNNNMYPGRSMRDFWLSPPGNTQTPPPLTAPGTQNTIPSTLAPSTGGSTPQQ